MDILLAILKPFLLAFGMSKAMLSDITLLSAFGAVIILIMIWGLVFFTYFFILTILYHIGIKGLIFLQTKLNLKLPYLNKFIDKKINEAISKKEKEDIKIKEDLEIFIKSMSSTRSTHILENNYETIHKWFSNLYYMKYMRRTGLMAYCRYTVVLSNRTPDKYYYDITAFGEDVTELMVPSLKGKVDKKIPDYEKSLELKRSALKDFVFEYDHTDNNTIKYILYVLIKSILSFQKNVGDNKIPKDEIMSDSTFKEIVETFSAEKNINKETFTKINEIYRNDPIQKQLKDIKNGIIEDIEYITSIREIRGDVLELLLNIQLDGLKHVK